MTEATSGSDGQRDRVRGWGGRSARPRRDAIKMSPSWSRNETFEILVTGESMWPELVPGQRYTARRDVEPKLGDIVVAQHPTDSSQTIVKRVASIIPSSDIRPLTFRLSGTVSWSSTFKVSRPQILGVIDR